MIRFGQNHGRPRSAQQLSRQLELQSGGLVGVLALVMASATVWLVLTDPVTVAESVDAGEVSPLVKSLATTIFEALRGLMKYL